MAAEYATMTEFLDALAAVPEAAEEDLEPRKLFGRDAMGEIREQPMGGDDDVTIPDPDDPHGMPLYEGPLADAHTWLVPGEYVALTTAGETTVTIRPGVGPAAKAPARVGSTGDNIEGRGSPQPRPRSAAYAECNILVTVRFVLEGRFTSVSEGFRIVRKLLDNTTADAVELDGARIQWVPASWERGASYLTRRRRG